MEACPWLQYPSDGEPNGKCKINGNRPYIGGYRDWGFPKIRVPFGGVPKIRMNMFLGLYCQCWGLPIAGSYYIMTYAYVKHVKSM